MWVCLRLNTPGGFDLCLCCDHKESHQWEGAWADRGPHQRRNNETPWARCATQMNDDLWPWPWHDPLPSGPHGYFINKHVLMFWPGPKCYSIHRNNAEQEVWMVNINNIQEVVLRATEQGRYTATSGGQTWIQSSTKHQHSHETSEQIWLTSCLKGEPLFPCSTSRRQTDKITRFITFSVSPFGPHEFRRCAREK